MVTNLKRTMRTISDTCLDRREKEMITSHGTALRSLDNRPLAKVNIMDAHSRLLEMIT